jgi:hypothetical protein
MMVKPSPIEPLAIRICKAAHDLKGSEFHWIGVTDLCKQMKVKHSEGIDEALLFASKNGWLDCSPPPTHSVLLTQLGALAAMGKLKRKK